MDVDVAMQVCNEASHIQVEIELTERIKKAMRITTWQLAMLRKKNTPVKHTVMGADCYCPACEKKIAYIDKHCRHCGQALIRY